MPRVKDRLKNPRSLNRKNQIIFAIREKYSIDDELAILRQRDTKPEEFQEYFEFVENIKSNLTEKGVN